MGVVLVVDDDEDIRAAMRQILVAEGYAVREAADGGAALLLLSTMETLPCLVLLDMMMPGMNGEDVLDAIADEPRLVGLPVVMVTAYPGVIRGAPRRVLRKPLTLTLLLDTVAEFCERTLIQADRRST